MDVQQLTRDAAGAPPIVEAPRYRVDFWHRRKAAEEGGGQLGYKLESSLLTSVTDVSEALEWGRVEARDRTYVLYAYVGEEAGEPLLVQLEGVDRTRPRT